MVNIMSVYTILIVEDEANQRLILEHALYAPEHWSIVSTADAQEALASIGERPPDLIITDYQMRAMNGLELIGELRARGIDSRIILLTAYGSIDLREAAQRLGIDHYLMKPVKLKLLRHLTNAALT